MTDSAKKEASNGKLEHAVRTIIAKPSKKRHILEDSSIISKLARDTVHNLMKVTVSIYNSKGTDRMISLITEDSSYDLNGFYEQLTKHGYRIQ